MNSRERVYATLDFTGPDRIPIDHWALPATYIGREESVWAIEARHPLDFYRPPYRDPFSHPNTYTPGTYVDVWGSEWLVLKAGRIGEVKRGALDDYDKLLTYHWPLELLELGWEDVAAGIAANRDKFVLGGWIRVWEQMQFLRRTEELYLDLAEDCEQVYVLRDKVAAFYRANIERWLRFDLDAVVFSDDWGSQRSLLINPAKWRSFFKPVYRELVGLVRDAGKRVFFHSDGYIADIYPDLIEVGVNAVNSQVWCMGLDTLAPYAGQITFWGEMDRQHVLPNGTPDDVRRAARQMYQAFYRNGGLIGQAEVDDLTPLENIEALLSSWGEIAVNA